MDSPKTYIHSFNGLVFNVSCTLLRSTMTEYEKHMKYSFAGFSSSSFNSCNGEVYDTASPAVLRLVSSCLSFWAECLLPLPFLLFVSADVFPFYPHHPPFHFPLCCPLKLLTFYIKLYSPTLPPPPHSFSLRASWSWFSFNIDCPLFFPSLDHVFHWVTDVCLTAKNGLG